VYDDALKRSPRVFMENKQKRISLLKNLLRFVYFLFPSSYGSIWLLAVFLWNRLSSFSRLSIRFSWRTWIISVSFSRKSCCRFQLIIFI